MKTRTKIFLASLVIVIAAVAVIKKIESDSWYVFRNEKYGYEIKYPSNWYASHTSAGYSNDTFVTHPHLRHADTWHGVVSINAKQWPADWPLDELRSDLDTSWDIESVPITKKFNGYESLFISRSDDIPPLQGEKLYFLKNSNIGLQLRIWSGDMSSGRNKKLDQIASTFKFFTPKISSDTSDWLAYRNTKYGYEFKYPKDSHITGQITDQNNEDGGHIYLPATPTSTTILINGGAAFRIDVRDGDLQENLGKPITFLGNPARKNVIYNGGVTYQIAHNNKLYSISMYDLTGRMYNIISTFKFIE